MYSYVAPNQPTGWLTWGRLVAITLAVMLGGVVGGMVMIGHLGLFAPPLLPYTIPFYLLVWLPIFVVGLFMRPRGDSYKPLLLLLILGAMIIVIGLVILGPTFNYTSGICQRAPLPEKSMRYECSLTNYQQSRVTYVLEGREGSLFVQYIPPTRPAPGG